MIGSRLPPLREGGPLSYSAGNGPDDRRVRFFVRSRAFLRTLSSPALRFLHFAGSAIALVSSRPPQVFSFEYGFLPVAAITVVPPPSFGIFFMWSGARESSGGGSRDNDDDDDDGDDDHIAESDDDAVDEYVAGLERGGQDSGPSRPDRNRASDREDDITIIPPASPIP
jgi:hypothetical protein